MSIRSYLKALRTPFPVYTTRPHGPRHQTGTLSISLWIALAAMFLVFANAIGWGIYGLVYLLGQVV